MEYSYGLDHCLTEGSKMITLKSKNGDVEVKRIGYNSFDKGLLFTSKGHSVKVPLPRHVSATVRKGGLFLRMDTGVVGDRPRITAGATVYDVNGFYSTFNYILVKLKEHGFGWIHNYEDREGPYFVRDLLAMTGD